MNKIKVGDYFIIVDDTLLFQEVDTLNSIIQVIKIEGSFFYYKNIDNNLESCSGIGSKFHKHFIKPAKFIDTTLWKVLNS